MSGQNPSSNHCSRTYWTPTMERYFVDLMLEHIHRGNRIGHTFNKQAWTDMLAVFNAKFGSQYDKDVLKGRYTNLWKLFNDVKNLLGQKGFSWDETRQMVVADDYVWEAYIKTLQNQSVLNFDDLCLIYGYTVADGRYSRSSHDVDVEDENQGLIWRMLFWPYDMIRLLFSLWSSDDLAFKEAELLANLSHCSAKGMMIVEVIIVISLWLMKFLHNKSSRTDWTPDMDQYFIELMLKQQERGNKLDSTFTKQAWTEMLALFNANFSSEYNKRVLRHRYKKLWKYYSDLMTLVKQKGFVWDEKQEMVIAHNDVWDAYIKAVNVLEHIGLHQWTGFFIDLMLNQVNRGNRIGPSFITQAWNDMVESFNANFNSHHDREVLKNRYKHFRKLYNDVMILLQHKGFSWDEGREMVTAEDHVWDAYIKAHPDARSYRVKTVPCYHKLCIIYGQDKFDASYSRLVGVLDPAVGTFCMKIGNGKREESHDGADPITDWSPPMEQYFVDLMLEQVHHGYKIDNEFEHPEAVSYKDKVIGHYSELCTIFGPTELVDVKASSEMVMELDLHPIDMKIDKYSGDLPVTFLETEIYNQARKRTASTSLESCNKAQKTGITSMITELVNKEAGNKYFAIESAIDALQSLPGIDDELLLDGCDLLEDERKAKTFLALDATIRKKWLLRKLGRS
ncbi:UNVERIFIED_CONTAM: hypothetical protein Scaly_2363400 [Sesamum calycinum]|uniref:Myb/SANT-like domain-containing protein n=1 Tax=Sesamum calycinum TaxID=2727403 RepID=A0AAW2M047_9LAMI